MKKLLLILIVGFLAWKGYTAYQSHKVTLASEREVPEATRPETAADSDSAKPLQTTSFKCDGRIYCSQMTSCEEATYFLKNCPGVKMDGDNDGVPCERQWCR
jgi:Excalibur calcium-binding domain